MSLFFFFKQKTAYEMRISDWSSDVCSSDLICRDAQIYEWQRRWCRNDGLHPPRNRVAVRTRAALKPAAQWMQPTAAENQWRHSAPLHRRTEPSSPSTRRQDGPYPDLSAPGSALGAAAPCRGVPLDC